ncbi:MAG: CoA-binding protein [Proteobacteria bacterium]|nr:MAG: CoA-binding protein [Pseudomonadota bacterium]
MKEKVAILGASDRPERYAHMAFRMLKEYGHETMLVSPKLKAIEGQPVYASLGEIKEPVDTLTMYVGPATSREIAAEILNLKPKRVIFNPGSENPELAEKLRQANVAVENACTLVLLRSGQF